MSSEARKGASSLRIEMVRCESCGLDWPALENMAPGVERDTQCQRCYSAEVARLRREIRAYADEHLQGSDSVCNAIAADLRRIANG